MIFALLGLSVLVCALAGLLWRRSRHGLIRERLRRQVVVTLKSGETFLGVLWAADGQALVLRNASLLNEKAQPVSLDGEVVALRGDVSFVQVV